MEDPKDFFLKKMNSTNFTCAVLSVDLIFDYMCSFLPLEDLKQFRLVCRTWKDISESAFKKRVRICFDFDPSNRNHENHTCYNKSSFTQYPAPEDLNAFFRNSLMAHPFTAIRISNVLPWTNSALTEFFSTEGKHITDLVLHEVKLNYKEDSDHNSEVEGFHFLMSIFGGIANLEKLDVECFDDDSTCFALTLHDLARIQCIKLQYCVVEVTDSKIAPKELELGDIIFVKNGEVLETVLLNDFVNFTLMEKLTTRASLNEWVRYTTKMKLNLFGNENVKRVKVDNWDVISDGEIFDDIVDFKNSSWEIETLDLCEIPFQQVNNTIIRNLFIDRIQFSPHHFPQSLQKLQLSDNVEFPENLQWNFCLSKLKILDLTGTDTINAVFPYLLFSFPNLVELKLKWKHYSRGIAPIDINLIPTHVQKMLFDGTDFDFLGEGVRAIRTLVLRSANLNFAIKVCNHFVLKNFIVFLETEELKVGADQSLFTALSKISDQGIIFGLFDCKNTGHESDDFVFPSVDIPGEFYSYINGRGDVLACKYGARNKTPLKFIQLISQMAEFQ